MNTKHQCASIDFKIYVWTILFTGNTYITYYSGSTFAILFVAIVLPITEYEIKYEFMDDPSMQ